MVSLSRKLTETRIPNPITIITKQQSPVYHNHQTPQETHQHLNQISQIEQRKIFESRLVSLIDSSDTLNQTKQIHAHIIRKGLDHCCYVIAKLIRVLTSKFDVPMDPYPRHVFQQVKRPNPFLYTALIRGYSVQGPFIESVMLYNLMRRQGIDPVSFTFTALLKACSGFVDVNFGMQIHGHIVSLGGFSSDLYVSNTLIDMYVECGLLDCARKVFDEMPERDAISWTSLIVAYTRINNMDEASELFDGLQMKDMVAWTAMVMGFVHNAQPRAALECFDAMQEAGVETDEVTLASVISACAQLGATKYAKWVRNIAEKAGFGPMNNVVIGSALIDMYSKCGSIKEAYLVFSSGEDQNIVLTNAMISGFSRHGRSMESMVLFEKMQQMGLQPNEVTYVSVLSACGHMGLVKEAERYFDLMVKEHNVSPNVFHYACMVDVLGRTGLIHEAKNLIDKMPFEATASIWGSLLSSCRVHGNVEMAEISAKHLFEIEPENAGNHVLLSNIYAANKRWDEVIKSRKLLKETDVKKERGKSWIEIKDKVHAFMVGERTHRRIDEIYSRLGVILEEMRKYDYRGETEHDLHNVDEGQKEELLRHHSEKLALVFGLICLPLSAPIRIMKNLRICGDCHVFMKLASKITGREIIVRDTNRFHHFTNGVCSCGEFW